MTKQRESKLSRQIMQHLRDEGVFCFKVHGSQYMMAGLPDVIACVGGYFLGIETKLPETREDTSKRQEYVHSLIRRSGGRVEVVCSVDEARQIIAEMRP